MKKILIEIDLASIIKNPNAGNTVTKRLLSQSFIVKGYGDIPDILIDGENWDMMELHAEPSFKRWKGVVFDSDVFNEVAKLPQVTSEVQNEFQTYHHRPEPEYFYKHLHQEVKCKFCGEDICTDELKSDFANKIDQDDNEYFTTSDTVCPKCDEWDCCDVEFESIESALNRKLKNKQ